MAFLGKALSRKYTSSMAFTSEIDEPKPLAAWKMPNPSKANIYAHMSIFSLKAKTLIHEEHGTFHISDSHLDTHFLHLLAELEEYRTKALAKGYNFVHLGYVCIGITPLFRKGLDVTCLGALLDTRHKNFNDQLIGVIEGPLSNGPIFLECRPNFTISLTEPYFKECLTLHVKTHGLDIKSQTEHIQIAYRLVVRAVNTTLPSVYARISISDKQDDKGQNIVL